MGVVGTSDRPAKTANLSAACIPLTLPVTAGLVGLPPARGMSAGAVTRAATLTGGGTRLGKPQGETCRPWVVTGSISVAYRNPTWGATGEQ